MAEQANGQFTQFKNEAEMARETKWRTGFIVVMDDNGRVFVDNSRSNFGNTVDHDCSINEAILILGMALEEFKMDRVRVMVMEAVKMELVRVSRASQPQT